MILQIAMWTPEEAGLTISEHSHSKSAAFIVIHKLHAKSTRKLILPEMSIFKFFGLPQFRCLVASWSLDMIPNLLAMNNVQ